MEITLTKDLETLILEKVKSGRYLDESEVVRDALRALQQRDDFESPALEFALLEGVRGPHRTYDEATLERVRTSAQRLK